MNGELTFLWHSGGSDAAITDALMSALMSARPRRSPRQYRDARFPLAEMVADHAANLGGAWLAEHAESVRAASLQRISDAAPVAWQMFRAANERAVFTGDDRLVSGVIGGYVARWMRDDAARVHDALRVVEMTTIDEMRRTLARKGQGDGTQSSFVGAA